MNHISRTELSPAGERIIGKWNATKRTNTLVKKGYKWPRTPSTRIPETFADNRARPPVRPLPPCAGKQRHLCLSVSVCLWQSLSLSVCTCLSPSLYVCLCQSLSVFCLFSLAGYRVQSILRYLQLVFVMSNTGIRSESYSEMVCEQVQDVLQPY